MKRETLPELRKHLYQFDTGVCNCCRLSKHDHGRYLLWEIGISTRLTGPNTKTPGTTLQHYLNPRATAGRKFARLCPLHRRHGGFPAHHRFAHLSSTFSSTNSHIRGRPIVFLRKPKEAFQWLVFTDPFWRSALCE